MSTRNVSWGDKVCWCIGLTLFPPSCGDCLKIWELQPPATLRACADLYRNYITFTSILFLTGTQGIIAHCVAGAKLCPHPLQQQMCESIHPAVCPVLQSLWFSFPHYVLQPFYCLKYRVYHHTQQFNAIQ
jgi:hypothetical protein